MLKTFLLKYKVFESNPMLIISVINLVTLATYFLLFLLLNVSFVFAQEQEKDTVNIFANSIEEAMKNPLRVRVLYLHNKTKFPLEILRMKNIYSIHFTKCTIKSLPPEVKELEYLRSINIKNATFIPRGLYHFPNLYSITFIDLPYNFQDTYKEANQLKHLTVVRVFGNKIPSLHFANLKSISLMDFDAKSDLSILCKNKDIVELLMGQFGSIKLSPCIKEFGKLKKTTILGYIKGSFLLENLQELEEIDIGYFDSLKEIPPYLYDLPKLKKVTINLDIRKDELNQDEYKAIYDKFKERGISFEVD